MFRSNYTVKVDDNFLSSTRSNTGGLVSIDKVTENRMSGGAVDI
jgi:hypothetical protein